jgi:hypothetical protein
VEDPQIKEMVERDRDRIIVAVLKRHDKMFGTNFIPRKSVRERIVTLFKPFFTSRKIMSSEMAKGLTYEEAHAARPVGYIFNAKTVTNNLSPKIQAHITLGERQNPTDVDVYTADVVNTLKGQISELQEQLADHKSAFDNMRSKYEAERLRQFTEPGWFFPKSWISDSAGESLNHLIDRAKQASITNIIVAPGQPYEVKYEGDWIKYGFEVTPAAMPVAEDKAATLFDAIKHGDEAHQSWLKEAITAHFAGEAVPGVVMKASDDQSWVVKLGAAIARYNNPRVVNGLSGEKLDEIYKRLMEQLGMPQSHSLLGALQQLTNELTFDSSSLLDIVQLVCGNKKESEVFWGNTTRVSDDSPLYTVSKNKLLDAGNGTQPAKVAKLLGKQAGVVHYVGGRLRMYDMGDTYAAELKVFPVFFEDGAALPEPSPLIVTREQVGLSAPVVSAALASVMHNWAKGASRSIGEALTPFYQNARQELDCTSCPMQAVLEGCCKEMRSSTAPQTTYEQELAKYTDALDATLDAYVTESMFKTSPEYMEKIKANIREHYLNKWKAENAELFRDIENDCKYPGSNNKCCTRNRAAGTGCILNGEQAVAEVSRRMGVGAPAEIVTGVQDNSVKKAPFFTEAQLTDPTLLQKAVVMGMAGNPAQQEEARVFLTQYLAITTNSHAAADAYLKQ